MTEYHRPVMLQECIDGLNINPNGIYVDVTYGGGGHSAEILKKLKKGTLVAFDQDKDALENLPKNKRLVFVHHNFRFLKRFLRYHEIEQINGLLADLGVSSHHLDAPDRGFSFRFGGDLDMRMNQDSEKTAADLLNNYPEEDLKRIFRTYGELKNAGKVTFCIAKARSVKALKTIKDLTDALEGVLPKHKENQFLAKIFQAIRIELNDELGALKEMLEQARDVLAPGGRLVVISYHSLEDRMVKNFMRWGNFEGKQESDIYGNVPQVFKLITKSVVTASEEELEINNRARSAKLRIAEKI